MASAAAVAVRKRQKVKPYFLPVQSAKKSRQSPPFFGKKATQHQGWADFCAAKSHLTSLDQPSAYLSKSSGYFLTLTNHKAPPLAVSRRGTRGKKTIQHHAGGQEMVLREKCAMGMPPDDKTLFHNPVFIYFGIDDGSARLLNQKRRQIEQKQERSERIYKLMHHGCMKFGIEPRKTHRHIIHGGYCTVAQGNSKFETQPSALLNNDHSIHKENHRVNTHPISFSRWGKLVIGVA